MFLTLSVMGSLSEAALLMRMPEAVLWGHIHTRFGAPLCLQRLSHYIIAMPKWILQLRIRDKNIRKKRCAGRKKIFR